MLLTPLIPPLSAFVMCGVYKTPAVQTDVIGVMTNKFPTDAIRGAGRPEATHMIEVDDGPARARAGHGPARAAAQELHPAVRHRPRDRRSASSTTPGDYEAALDKLLEHIDPAEVHREAEALREQGIYRGIGFCTYTEICGNAPSRVVGPGGVRPAGRRLGVGHGPRPRHRVGHRSTPAPRRTARVTRRASRRSSPTGSASTRSEVDVDPRRHRRPARSGLDTYGSRSLAVGGEAVARAAEKVADKAKAIVAHQLEAAPEDIELRDGKFSVRGSPDKGMTLAEVAGAAYVAENLPEGMEPGLDETTFYDPENFVFPFGAHACVVDVDAETGKVKVVRYVAVDDCGPAINPMLIDGQVHGGIMHGIGQALYERIHYDEAGQLVTGTFVDYALPTAAELPSFETDRTETPSPVNSLGVKGVGEAGTIAATAGGHQRRDRRAAPARSHITSTCRSARCGSGRPSRKPREAVPA